MTLRAALYLRYSSILQDEATIETQRVECTRKATDLGAVVVAEYVDQETTATRDDRDGFQTMIRDSKKTPPPWDIIIVRKFSRFARNVLESRTYKAILRKHGIRVVSVYETTSDDASGQLLEGMIEVLDEYYSKQLAQETISGMTTNARKGFRNGGMAPYGYRNAKVSDAAAGGKERTRLEIFEPEALVVRRIFREYADGKGLRTIAEILQDEGFSPRKAKAWSAPNLHNILSWEVYRGDLVWRKSGSKDGWVRSHDESLRLVDEETWGKVQARKAANKKAGAGNRALGSVHPLSGLIWCGECGGRFIIASDSSGYGCYFRCANREKRQNGKKCENSRSFNETKNVPIIQNMIARDFFTSNSLRKAVEDVAKEAGERTATSENDLTILRRELTKAKMGMARMMDELAAGELPRSVVIEKIRELEGKAAGLTAAIAKEEAELEKNQVPNLTENDYRDLAAALSERILQIKEPARLKHVFMSVGLRITVWKNQAKIETTPEVGGCFGLENAEEGRLPIPKVWRIYPMTSASLPVPAGWSTPARA